jgi:hypothetical protein
MRVVQTSIYVVTVFCLLYSVFCIYYLFRRRKDFENENFNNTVLLKF